MLDLQNKTDENQKKKIMSNDKTNYSDKKNIIENSQDRIIDKNKSKKILKCNKNIVNSSNINTSKNNIKQNDKLLDNIKPISKNNSYNSFNHNSR